MGGYIYNKHALVMRSDETLILLFILIDSGPVKLLRFYMANRFIRKTAMICFVQIFNWLSIQSPINYQYIIFLGLFKKTITCDCNMQNNLFLAKKAFWKKKIQQ
jgi:hypothetical protein